MYINGKIGGTNTGEEINYMYICIKTRKLYSSIRNIDTEYYVIYNIFLANVL